MVKLMRMGRSEAEAGGAVKECGDKLIVYVTQKDYFCNNVMIVYDAYVVCVYYESSVPVDERFLILKDLWEIISTLKVIRRLSPLMTELGYDFGEDFIG